MATVLYLQHGKPGESLSTEKVEHKESVLPWQARGLSYTTSGYGHKIPTPYMVHYLGRWHRVYCRIFSNSGNCYIVSKGQEIRVTEYEG